MLNSPLRYFHTLRHLKPVQIYGRGWRQLHRPVPELAPAPHLRTAMGAWTPGPCRRQSIFAPTRCRYLNEEHEIATASDWDNPEWGKLWRYNLHYFDDLNAEDAESRGEWHRALIARWNTENPPAGGTGWEAYPTSIRIVNWIKWSITGHSLSSAAEHSLAVQARWLRRRVETHLLGNHLMTNAKALVFAGNYFEGAEADGWLGAGLDVLAHELPEQILSDGGHFERSPMYHALALEDVLDLINVTRAYASAIPDRWQEFVRGWPGLAGSMCRWLETMCHPDGEIAFFNDAAMGVALSPPALKEFADRLAIPVAARPTGGLVHLDASGYVRMQRHDWLVLFDAAPVGPDYLPGHAHADTLSFELSFHGVRVICNSGTSRYGHGAVRDWERSTAAHNTVEIDGESSSEVWGGFRVARRAYPYGCQVSENAASIQVICAHDGYMRLRGRPRHRRTIDVAADHVSWTDEILGTSRHTAIGRIPLHPDISVLRIDDTSWHLNIPNGTRLRLSVQGAGARLDAEIGRYSPQFGLTQERPVLHWRVSEPLPLRIGCRLEIVQG